MLQNQRLSFNSKDPFVPTFVKSVVFQASNPLEIYATRVHNRKILLENPIGKKEKKPKKKRNVQRGFPRISGSWSLDPHQAKWVEMCYIAIRLLYSLFRFDLFVPLHHLWMGYMSELLMLNAAEIPSSASIHPKLLKADFSGSFVSGKCIYL